jgi:hypothetical protein
MFELLNEIYRRSEEECDIDIAFRLDEHGRQANPARDLIVEYLRNPIIQNGRLIAARLESFTDRRSGLGLLFLIGGLQGRDHKIVISRFPTDSAILVVRVKRLRPSTLRQAIEMTHAVTDSSV